MNKRAFTMIELLIVISIIAILAAAIIPNFIGFDTEARVSTTRSNVDTVRTRITLFRAKEGKYPASLGDLVDYTYLDSGVKKPYLNRIPAEMISDKRGNSSFEDIASDQPLSGKGGWVYIIDRAELKVNVDKPLDKSWGSYANEKPSDW
ncbi:MAG: hypothetical protein AUJ89_05490 [Candidatus Omnitrophica bacterium CG1_02_43_210]|nr:MAG: hypothetical protein AUJ89_05490 [Candidatus Omnitrophica bacterium CG1_02_43_210]PIV38932.1 MAG: hypothetical protein COS29_05290 [Candidatus Omnitrophica bacterium CG02_land_8_20_14_3_00__42_8]